MVNPTRYKTDTFSEIPTPVPVTVTVKSHIRPWKMERRVEFMTLNLTNSYVCYSLVSQSLESCWKIEALLCGLLDSSIAGAETAVRPDCDLKPKSLFKILVQRPEGSDWACSVAVP